MLKVRRGVGRIRYRATVASLPKEVSTKLIVALEDAKNLADTPLPPSAPELLPALESERAEIVRNIAHMLLDLKL